MPDVSSLFLILSSGLNGLRLLVSRILLPMIATGFTPELHPSLTNSTSEARLESQHSRLTTVVSKDVAFAHPSITLEQERSSDTA